MPESIERSYLPLDKFIKLEDHFVISNVWQRTEKGGRPDMKIVTGTAGMPVEP